MWRHAKWPIYRKCLILPAPYISQAVVNYFPAEKSRWDWRISNALYGHPPSRYDDNGHRLLLTGAVSTRICLQRCKPRNITWSKQPSKPGIWKLNNTLLIAVPRFSIYWWRKNEYDVILQIPGEVTRIFIIWEQFDSRTRNKLDSNRTFNCMKMNEKRGSIFNHITTVKQWNSSNNDQFTLSASAGGWLGYALLSCCQDRLKSNGSDFDSVHRDTLKQAYAKQAWDDCRDNNRLQLHEVAIYAWSLVALLKKAIDYGSTTTPHTKLSSLAVGVQQAMDPDTWNR